MYRFLTFSFILKILILKAVWPVVLGFLFLEDNVLSQNKVTFYQPDLEESVTQIYIHTLFSDFAVDPTLPSLFGTAALAFQCPNSEDLEPTKICNKQLQVLEEGERERWGGLLHFIKIMQWERWICEGVHVHERESSANILLKWDGSSVLCHLACPSGQAQRQRR